MKKLLTYIYINIYIQYIYIYIYIYRLNLVQEDLAENVKCDLRGNFKLSKFLLLLEVY